MDDQIGRQDVETRPSAAVLATERPLAPDQLAVPAEQRLRLDDERGPPRSGKPPARRGQEQPVRPLEAGPLYLSTQDFHLVAEHEQFDISVVHRAMSGAQRAADEVVDERQQHVTPSSRERMLIGHLDSDRGF
jgi:hypothetical protein